MVSEWVGSVWTASTKTLSPFRSTHWTRSREGRLQLLAVARSLLPSPAALGYGEHFITVESTTQLSAAVQVKKFMVGFEMLAQVQRDLTAEKVRVKNAILSTICSNRSSIGCSQTQRLTRCTL